MSNFRILPRAALDLEEIGLYIAEVNPNVAMRTVSRIEEVCQTLAENPMMGRSRDDLAQNLRSFPVGNYLIFYRPTENGIEIIRVINAARDISALF